MPSKTEGFKLTRFNPISFVRKASSLARKTQTFFVFVTAVSKGLEAFSQHLEQNNLSDHDDK